MSPLRGRTKGDKLVGSNYVPPIKLVREREFCQAHCMTCYRETKHEIVRFDKKETVTCTACGHQET